MNIGKLTAKTMLGMTLLTAATCAGIRSCQKRDSQELQQIEQLKHNLMHNQKDSIFWTSRGGSDCYVREQEWIKSYIDDYTEKEEKFKKLTFWQQASERIRRIENSRQLNQLERECFYWHVSRGDTLIHVPVKRSTGATVYTTTRPVWVESNKKQNQ